MRGASNSRRAVVREKLLSLASRRLSPILMSEIALKWRGQASDDSLL